MFQANSSVALHVVSSSALALAPLPIAMVWQSARKGIEAEVGSATFSAFLDQLRLEGECDGKVTLSTPTAFLKKHVSTIYAATILRHLQSSNVNLCDINIVQRGLGTNSQTVNAPVVVPAAARLVKSFPAVPVPPRPAKVKNTTVYASPEDAVLGSDEVASVASSGRPSVHLIQAISCAYFKVTREELLGSKRAAIYVRARQIAMYLCRDILTRSTSDIGQRFGGRDHTTVIHAIKQMEARPTLEADLRHDIDLIRELLQTVVDRVVRPETDYVVVVEAEADHADAIEGGQLLRLAAPVNEVAAAA